MLREWPKTWWKNPVLWLGVVMVSLSPRQIFVPSRRLVEDGTINSLVTIFLTELVPIAGVLFLLLFGYIFIAEMVDQLKLLTHIKLVTGVGFGIIYIVIIVVVWVDPRTMFNIAQNGVLRTSQLIYGSQLRWVVDPVTVRTIEYDLLRALGGAETVIASRSTGSFNRWPFYLLASYLVVTSTAKASGWLETSPQPTKVGGRLIGTGFAFLYGLILSHNFFPGFDALPWGSMVMTVWLVSHTVVAMCVLLFLQWTVFEDVDIGIVPTITIFLLVGMLVALLDGLYPLPELLILAGIPLTVIGTHFTNSRLPNLSPQLVDIESQLINGLANAWKSPTKLFYLLVAFQGLWLAGWLLWMMFIGYGWTSQIQNASIGALIGILIIFFVLLGPILIAVTHIVFYWIGEIRHLAAPEGPYTPLPDLLFFPSLILFSLLSSMDLYDIHPIGGVFAVCGVLVGIWGVRWSFQRRGDQLLPRKVRRHSITISGFVMFAGLGLSSIIAPSPYGESGSYIIFLLLTLIPLSTYPFIHKNGIGPLSPRSCTLALIVSCTLAGAVYMHLTDPLTIFISGFLGVVAICLSISATMQNTHNYTPWSSPSHGKRQQ